MMEVMMMEIMEMVMKMMMEEMATIRTTKTQRHYWRIIHFHARVIAGIGLSMIILHPKASFIDYLYFILCRYMQNSYI